MYYTSLEYYLKMYDETCRQLAADFTDEKNFLEWQKKARKKLKELIKLDKIEGCDLNPELIEEVKVGDITRQKILLQVQPNVYMPVYILIPDGCKDNKKAKCFIAMSGHLGGGMESIVGIRENESVVGAIEKFDYDYGLQLAKRGNVVVCPETRGFGERREALAQGDEKILNCSCYNLARVVQSMGHTLMGLQIWDVQRLIDYLLDRAEWDMNDLRILGFSGGGLQALYSAAIDERIKKVIVSGYMYGYKESLMIKNGNCNCNYVEGLWQNFDMGDIGAMIAPRPFVIQSGNEDHLNGASGLNNVYSQVEIVSEAYKLLSCEDKVKHDVCEGPHRWYGSRLDAYLEWLN